MSRTVILPQPRKARGKNLTQKTLSRLREDIISGKLPPGAIVRDVELAAIYGVSTSPLREALTLLETEQLVVMPSERVRQIAPISRKTMEEIGELINLLMDYAICKGIKHLTEKDIAELEYQIEKIKEAKRKNKTHDVLFNTQLFYDVIIRACGNVSLRRTIMLHAGWIERLFTLAIPVERSGWFELAESILEGIKNGDRAQVMKSVRKYHTYFLELIKSLPLHG